MLHLQTIEKRNIEVTFLLRDLTESIEAEAVNLEIWSENKPNYALQIIADTAPKTPHIETYEVEKFKNEYPKYANRKFADPANQEQIGLVLGNNFLWHLIESESKMQVEENLFLLNSIFGWLLVGRMPQSKCKTYQRVSCTSVQTTLNKLWSLEALG